MAGRFGISGQGDTGFVAVETPVTSVCDGSGFMDTGKVRLQFLISKIEMKRYVVI
jgi:hypothetical protein